MLRLILILLLTFSMSIQGCSPSIKNIEAEGNSIVCFGDSITYGLGVGEGEDYPSVLGELSGVRVINAGVSGETTGDGVKRLDEDVFSEDPYLVIVEFGANDFLRQLPVEETIGNLREIVREIQGHGVMVAIVDVSGQWTGLGVYGIHHKKLKGLAKKEGCLFISRVMTDIANNPSLKSDRFHPNAGGYRIIAERVYEEIKPYIK